MNNSLSIIRLDAVSAIIEARGADTDAFLQGQLSNDIRALAPDRAQLSSYNSAKGRMLAVLTLSRRDGGIDIELPRGLIEPVARRLRMFVLRSKLTLTPSADAMLGLVGDGAADALAQAGLAVPMAPLDVVEADGLRIQRRLGVLPRYSLSGGAALIDALAARWAAHAADAAAWTLAQVRAGEPVVLPETQDHFVAQMANLDLLGGISFDKGCYTGQEIVARLHYLGQLKRRMFLCEGLGLPPEPGSDVHVQGQDQAVGEVVQSAADGNGGFAASVVLQLSQAEAEALRVGDTALGRPRTYAAA